MGGCAAINCSNHSKNKIRMFLFPTNEDRRKKWIVNCRRENWIPTKYSQLCIAHFEESQFETNRADGWKKLKPNAVPTLFDVPNPPQRLELQRIKGIGIPKPGSLLDDSSVSDAYSSSNIDVEKVSYTKAKAFKDKGDNFFKDSQFDKAVQCYTTAIEVCPPEYVDDLITFHQNRADAYENLKQELEKRIKALEVENMELKADVERKNVSLSFLSDEQIQLSGINKRSIPQWSNEGVIKGLKLRFALGKFGYNFLRSIDYPTPAYSTLNRRIQSLTVDFGILRNFVEILKTKVQSMPVLDRFCCVLIDEMEIAPNLDFDTSSKTFLGHVTRGNLDTVGNHYTVVMLRGLKSPWKQVIAHEVTGPATSGPVMKQLLSETIAAVSKIGLVVKASVSDMGSTNQALWKSLGVSVTRNERKTTYEMEGTAVHSIADVPHLLKNMRNAFLSRLIIIPEEIRKKENLPTIGISSGYVKQLWITELRENTYLRSLHHLKKEHLFPSHFSKMNVATAVQLFSIKTAAALEKAVHLNQISNEALTTAWFIRLLCTWFEMMTARHRKKSITKRNYRKKLEFLNSFISIMQQIKLGKSWKPLQTGMIMTSLSIINLSTELFEAGYDFLLPGRMTQDALENVFSQVRRKSAMKPTSLQAKRAIKMICVSQFITDLKNTNYSSDSDHHLLDFTDNNANASFDTNIEEMDENLPAPLSIVNKNDIFYIAGAAVNYLLKGKLCNTCVGILNDVGGRNVIPKEVKVLQDHCNMGGLKEATTLVFSICEQAEINLQAHRNSLLQGKISLHEIKDMCKNTPPESTIPSCCSLLDKLVIRYLCIRCTGIKNGLIQKKAEEAIFGSASAAKKQKSAKKQKVS